MICYISHIETRVAPFIKAFQEMGYKIIGVDIENYQNSKLLLDNKRLAPFIQAKQRTETENKNITEIVDIDDEEKQICKEIFSLPRIPIQKINLNKNDIFFTLEERFLYETAFFGGNIISSLQALTFTCKHIYYKKMKFKFFKIKSLEDLNNINFDRKFILKPSIDSQGRRNVFIINNKNDIKNILIEDPQIFSTGKIFILEEYIEHKTSIWVMCFFDKNSNPYILWYSTEKGHMTFSPFEEDLKQKIKDIAKKLNINNWMAYLEFLLDENGKLYFIDLNPRTPADDYWYEEIYKHMTNKSFTQIFIDLILSNKIPQEIRTLNYIKEEEYNGQNLESNQKVWRFPDGYKIKPLLTFKTYR